MTSKYEGLNPEQLADDLLDKMPAGARLLESEEERLAFQNEDTMHSDLYALLGQSWGNGFCGDAARVTYCTTRSKGWWKKQEPQPLTLGDANIGDVVTLHGNSWLVIGRAEGKTYFGPMYLPDHIKVDAIERRPVGKC